MMEEYFIVERAGQGEVIEKKSRFIAHVLLVTIIKVLRIFPLTNTSSIGFPAVPCGSPSSLNLCISQL